jgi:hypothetical protein
MERAVEIHERSPGPATPSLSMSLYHLASARAAVGDLDEAQRLMRRVVVIDERRSGTESTEVADDLEALASMQREAGAAAEAERTEARLRAIRYKAAPPTGP